MKIKAVIIPLGVPNELRRKLPNPFLVLVVGKLLGAILILVQISTCAHAAPDSVIESREVIAGQLLKRGLDLVSIESRQRAYIKGEFREKHTIILAKVKPTINDEPGGAYNPWATYKPSCQLSQPLSETANSGLRVGIIVIAPDGKISDAIFEKNIAVRSDERVQLTISSAEGFHALDDLPPGRKVFVLSSESCSDRAIYWNGRRYDFVPGNEDFEDLP